MGEGGERVVGCVCFSDGIEKVFFFLFLLKYYQRRHGIRVVVKSCRTGKRCCV